MAVQNVTAMYGYFNFALLNSNYLTTSLYFQLFQFLWVLVYLTSLTCTKSLLQRFPCFTNTTPSEEVNCDKDDDIDSFFVTVQKPTATVSVLEQLNSYLQQPVGDVESLGLFPQLKELFVRLNTPLPASAACERLFSSTGQIFTPKRATISDVNFEHQLLLKLNDKFRR